MIDAIFNAYFSVVPYGFFVAVMAFTFVAELFYTFITLWDMV